MEKKDLTLEYLSYGNVLNYHTAEGEILPTVINFHDLEWINEDPKGFNLVYSPILITEEYLVKLGFTVSKISLSTKQYSLNELDITKDEEGFFKFWCDNSFFIQVKYVHYLQNLCNVIFGQQLKLINNN
jgi:hypothetical protein